MKTIEISVDIIISNMKNNKKAMMIIIGLFLILGIVIGMINVKIYEPSEEVKAYRLEEPLSLEIIERDGAYYYNAFLNLKQKWNYLDAYLLYLNQVELSRSSQEKILKMEEQLQNYRVAYKEMSDFYHDYPLALNNQIEETILFYKEEIDKLTVQKEQEELLLNKVVEGNYTDSYKNIQQSKSLSIITRLENNINMFEKQLYNLNDSELNSIANNTKKADEMLDKNYMQINKVYASFLDMLNELSQDESYEIIFNKRIIDGYFGKAGIGNELEEESILSNQRNNAVIYAKSIAGLDNRKEIFYASVTFFVLVGIVLSILAGSLFSKKI